MSLSNIEAALIQAYQGADLLLPTEYENAEFDKPAVYASVFFVPNIPSVASLGDGGSDGTDGFLQVDIYTERNKGTKTARDYCDQLRAHFKAGARFSYDGQGVLIRSCGRGPGKHVDGYYKVTNTIYWRAYIDRS